MVEKLKLILKQSIQRHECLAGVEIWALILTVLSIILGISSLAAVLRGYKPRNHISYIAGFRPRTKSMLIK